MKRKFLAILGVLLFSAAAYQLKAQIPFSMDEEVSDRNTPEGWNAVELPQGLPAFTAANTFDITASPYNAST